MKRTRIYLDKEVYKYLKAESKRTDKSVSEIIREKLRTEINQSEENLIKAIDETVGIWQYRTESVGETIRDIRKGNRFDNNLHLP